MKKLLLMLSLGLVSIVISTGVVWAKNEFEVIDNNKIISYSVQNTNLGISKLWAECKNNTTKDSYNNIILYDGVNTKNAIEGNLKLTSPDYSSGVYSCTIKEISIKPNTNADECNKFNVSESWGKLSCPADRYPGETLSCKQKCVNNGCKYSYETDEYGVGAYICKEYGEDDTSYPSTTVKSGLKIINPKTNPTSEACSAFNTETDSVTGETYATDRLGCIAEGCVWCAVSSISPGVCQKESYCSNTNSQGENSDGDIDEQASKRYTREECSKYTADNCPKSAGCVVVSSDSGKKCTSKDYSRINTDSCEAVFNGFGDTLHDIFMVFRIVGPLLVLGLSTLDYIKAITSKDADGLKSANNRLIKRLVLVVILFFLPTLLDVLLKIVEVKSCVSEVIK